MLAVNKSSPHSLRVKAAAALIYQVKVTLGGVKPPVWRRLLVSSSISLRKFHTVLQVAFGWTDSHLHGFVARGESYGILDADAPIGLRDDSGVRLDQVLRAAKDSMIYEYDFGDGWTHRVVLEKIVAAHTGIKTPRCIDGKRACPPEDCGGVFGYADFLQAIADPFHDRHEELSEWIGGDFDPNWFELAEVNEELAGN